MEQFVYVIGTVGLTGVVMLTCWATFFCAIMPVLFLVSALDGPNGGRFFKDEPHPRATRRAI